MKLIGIRLATCTPMTYKEAVDNGFEIGGRNIGSKPDAQGYILDYGYNSTPIWWDKEIIDNQFYNIDGQSSDEIASKVKTFVEAYKFNNEFDITKMSDASNKSNA